MEEEKMLTASDVMELMDARRLSELRARADEMRVEDIAELFRELPEEYHPRFFRLLHKEKAAEVFTEMDADFRESLIASFTDAELKNILDEMFLDDTVDLVEEMPANVVQRIIANSTPEDRRAINELLKYPPDSAGGIMTTEFVRLNKTLTVAEALAVIRRVGVNKETIYTCYVTDNMRHLLGIVSAKDLLLSAEDDCIGDLMEENIISIGTLEDQETAAQLMTKYSLMALPVVDTEHRLVGIITVDDAIDIIHEETEEDFSKMAAITPTETPYLRTPVARIWLNRIPWLALLMVSATFTGWIISSFETALSQVVVLTAFIPMLMDTGGNSGSQSSVTVIRNLSLGEVTLSDWWRVAWKEIRVAIMCGISLGALAFGKVMLVDHLIMHNPAVTISVAWTVAATLCLTILIAKLIGCLLPILARRIGLDPAVVASPFITTIVDAISLLVYFTIAKTVIPGLA
ncbi:MAG: magnesium transporter [Clostridia bacterium]|nr:magnesium transporter [Clostridia bacterium]MDY6185016.1 magnesium transporter [Eubacteriales bacterium]